MGRRSRLYQQRMNALAHVQNPGRKKSHPSVAEDLPAPPPTSDNGSSQDTVAPLENMHSPPQDMHSPPPIIVGPRGGTSRWTATRLRRRAQDENATELQMLPPASPPHQPLMDEEEASGSLVTSTDTDPDTDPFSVPILEDARSRLEKKLRSVLQRPSGLQDQNWHRQVLELLNKQLVEPEKSRRRLDLEVVHGYHLKEKAARRLLAHEKEWITVGVIPLSRKGRH
ncbi:hypothetical protein BZA05DRAFT_406817 [Tricharina praecox]|uniref:uncharacterized protein n=1 Tax=Tricharina praecox TaxID=43433 RepID=UPI00221F62EB|nr:uncharacterized protein BZA05DRAFT_406817 [Tricharina praecox]KAI5846049.1 hypothetical protein BZA05DRAFT_406817 [Tricharina praecox]